MSERGAKLARSWSRPSPPDFDGARRRMVERQIAGRGIASKRVLQAMGCVPRERFVPTSAAELAYEDGPLPIDGGQTISQPFIVALMADAAVVRPDDQVLEIGTGSGYAAAVLSLLGARVLTIERLDLLAGIARGRLAELGYGNVAVITGDGTQGWPESAPFDAIIVSAGGPVIPQTLRSQLAIGGRLIVPVGPVRGEQHLFKVTRIGELDYETKDFGAVAFVPLIGEEGWSDNGPAVQARPSLGA